VLLKAVVADRNRARIISALTWRRIRPRPLPLDCRPAAAINSYITEHNADPKPLTWTKPVDHIPPN
jgi:hypothetical protein